MPREMVQAGMSGWLDATQSLPPVPASQPQSATSVPSSSPESFSESLSKTSRILCAASGQRAFDSALLGDLLHPGIDQSEAGSFVVDHPDLTVAIEVVRLQLEFVVRRLIGGTGRGFAFVSHAPSMPRANVIGGPATGRAVTNAPVERPETGAHLLL